MLIILRLTSLHTAQQQKGTSLPVVVQAAPQDGPPSPTAPGHHSSPQQNNPQTTVVKQHANARHQNILK